MANFKHPYRQGAALITVMVIVFMVMALIASLTVTNFRTIKRLSNRQRIEQASVISYSVIDFGRAFLATTGFTSSIDTLNDIWAQPFTRTKILDHVYMSGYIIDEQSKFNINDLVSNGQLNQKVIDQFINLLAYINLPQGLAYHIAYYMAAPQYQEQTAQQYIMSYPSYRPAGRPLVDLSELILVKGINPAIIQSLVQYVTAIPLANNMPWSESGNLNPVPNPPQHNVNIVLDPGLAINVNTATAEVIAAKGNIPLTIAQRMVNYRVTNPFQEESTIKSYLQQNGIMESIPTASGLLNLRGLATSSKYFAIHAVIDNYDDQLRWLALVSRQNRSSGQWPLILWQHAE